MKISPILRIWVDLTTFVFTAFAGNLVLGFYGNLQNRFFQKEGIKIYVYNE